MCGFSAELGFLCLDGELGFGGIRVSRSLRL